MTIKIKKLTPRPLRRKASGGVIFTQAFRVPSEPGRADPFHFHRGRELPRDEAGEAAGGTDCFPSTAFAASCTLFAISQPPFLV